MSILILLAGLCLLRESFWWPVNAVDEAFADHLGFAQRQIAEFAQAKGWREAPAPAPVTLVEINEASLEDHPWPWNPLDFSLFLRAAQPFKPEIVAVEEVLEWDRLNLPQAELQKLPQYERMLRDSLLRTPKVLLGQRLGWPEDPDALPPIAETPLIRHLTGDLREVPEWTVIERQAKEEFRLSSAVGFTNIPQGRPSTTTVPLLLRYRGQIVPTFVLQAVLQFQKLSIDDVQVVLGEHITVGNSLRVPINKRGELRVNFGVPFLRLGFDDLLLAAEQTAAKQKPNVAVERMAGSIALLARTDAGARTFPLAWQRQVSSGEVFAAGIATIQSGSYLQRVSRWFDYAVIALAMLVGLKVPQWRKKRVALWCVAALVLYLLAAVAMYFFTSTWLPLVLPVGLLLFIAAYRAATPNSVWRLRKPVIL